MMLTRAVWHGDSASVYALIAAVDNNCDCQRNSNGALVRQCGAHAMMTDQRWLDRILWLRWLRPRLLDEEELKQSCRGMGYS